MVVVVFVIYIIIVVITIINITKFTRFATSAEKPIQIYSENESKHSFFQFLDFALNRCSSLYCSFDHSCRAIR